MLAGSAEAAEGARDALRYKMWRAVQDMGHPFGIEVQPEDLEFHEADVDWQIEVTCRWNPPSREAEMRGGLRDGEVLTFREAGSHLPLYFPAPVAPMSPFDGALGPELPTIKIAYRLAGWDEGRHRWVYDYTGPA